MKLAIAAALAASVSAKCNKGIFIKYYTDDECKTPLEVGGKNMTANITEDDAKVMNEECNELDKEEMAEVNKAGKALKVKEGKTAGFIQVKCDTKAMKSKVFDKDDEKKCEGEAIASMTIEWKECTKVAEKGEDKVYVIATGAQALAATAAAALAMVASQF